MIVLVHILFFLAFSPFQKRKIKRKEQRMSRRVFKINTKPLKMWIDGKCYNLKQYNQEKYKKLLAGMKGENKKSRIIPIQLDTKPDITISSQEVVINKKEMVSIQCNTTQLHDDKNDMPSVSCQQNNELLDLTTHEDGKFISSFQIPKYYYEKLRNFYGLDYLSTISSETNTTISVPSKGKPGAISIFGEMQKNVFDATNEVYSVIGKIRDQNMALQFIGIPCLSNEIKEKFINFKAEILNGDKIDGMHESIFQSPLRLHVTVTVLVLLDDREKAEAIQALQEYKTNVLDHLVKKNGPLKLHVSGIDCMQENLKKVDVLYANVKLVNECDDLSLQKIVNDVSHYFYERGLLRRYEENVKLHMTLINTKYRQLPNSPKKSRWCRRQSFDARSIMKKYKNYDFGYCDFTSIHLSLISSKGEDGFYLPLSVIKLTVD